MRGPFQHTAGMWRWLFGALAVVVGLAAVAAWFFPGADHNDRVLLEGYAVVLLAQRLG